MSVVDADTAAATPEANDAPEDRPLSDLPEGQDKYCDVTVQPQRPSGWHLHDADVDLRLRHIFQKALFQKAGVVAEQLYMKCDVRVVGTVSIYVFICIALYCLYGAIVYALRDQDMVY